MSHSHNDEADLTETLHLNNVSSTRRSSPGHINLKPTMVFDHIKTKVKRKRSANNLHIDVPTFAINGNLVGKRSIDQSHEVKLKKPLTMTRSQPIAVSAKSSDESDENDPSPEQYENGLDHSDSPEKDEDNNNNNNTESVRWRLESDNDTSTQTKASKSKLNRMSKLIVEPSQPIQRKTRRTLHSSSKTDINKKKKLDDTINTELLSAQLSIQIRDEDFHKIFKDIPSDEQLITAYPCAWRKDMFMHGRLFLTINHICFYTCFLKWEESLCIAFKDITSVVREKSAKLIPNAIQLKTKNREQYLFASYNQRERIFIGIYRLWKNALLENPLDAQQLKTIIFADQMNLDESSRESDESIGVENNLLINSGPTSRDSMQSNVNSDVPAYLSSCPCESHLAKTYAERTFRIPVDQLFDLTFGDNAFSRAYHDSQKLIDYTIGSWTKNNETGKRERQVTYKTVTQSILGTNTITCNEKQIIELDKPQSIYILTSEVHNEGMKYTDAFYVTTKFCMYQRDVKLAFLRVTAEVRYVKTVNAIARSFIEKNCHSNIESGVNNLVRRLENHQTTKTNSKSKKSSNKQQLEHSPSSEDKQDNQLPIINNEIIIQQRTITGKGLFFDSILIIGICILILHIYLCYKLYQFDRILSGTNIVCRKTPR